MERLLEFAPSGGGTFVDIGSGPDTANVVAYISLVWPRMFTGISAVDLKQNLSTARAVMEMRRRVSGVLGGVSAGFLRKALRVTCDITWWNILDEKSPDHVMMAFSGAATRCLSTAQLLADATFVYSADLLFDAFAVDTYRKEIARSLVDSREMTYVSCTPIGGGTLRTLPEGEWVEAYAGGTDDAHIGPFVKRFARMVARGTGTDVAWEDTTFYIAILQGPCEMPDPDVALELNDGGSAAAIARKVVNTSILAAYAEVKKHAETLETVFEGGVLGNGELTEPATTKILGYISSTVDIELRMGSGSKFVDIGSGFGKVVFNAALRFPTLSAVSGVELVPERHIASVQILDELRHRSKSWANRLERISFTYADATLGFDFTPFTHIFCYDATFDERTHRALFAKLSKIHFKVLVCFCNKNKLISRGWPMEDTPLYHLGKLKVGTTDQQRYMVNFWSREEVDR